MKTAITVIIADDHSVYVEGLYAIFHNNHDISIIDSANNGAELIKKVTIKQPDIILTDITMPIKDGIAATREINQLFPAIGIIALTVSDEDSSIIDMLEAGASGYLLKNSDKQEILTAIQTVHNRGTYYCRNTSNQLAKLVRNRLISSMNIKQPLLSEQELQIIRLLCEEKTSKEIANEVHLSDRTIESWRSRIQEKLNVRGTAGIVVYAIKTGIYKIPLKNS
jgi:DNA-binding NarL/FixJ family response regulator